MKVNVDTTAVSGAISQLRAIAGKMGQNRIFGNASSLTGFSPATGYSTSGNTLGMISDSRAPEANEAVAAHMLGIAATLEVALQNAMWADNSISGMLGSIGNAFGNLAVQTAGATNQMIQNAYSVEPKTNPFATPPAMAGPEASLELLSGLLDQARIPDAVAASQFWHSNAAMLRQAVDELNGVKHALASSAETVWVERAITTITQLQNAGSVYAGNSAVLAGHTDALKLTAEAEKLLAAVTVQIARAIPDPSTRASFEASYLNAYSPRVSGSLSATVPTFNRLLPDLRSLPGGSVEVADPRIPSVPNFGEKSLPSVVKEALSANGLGDLAHASSPAEVVQRYGHAGPEALKSIAAGATPTQAASAAAPSMPPPSALSQLGAVSPSGAAGVPGAGPMGGAFSPASLPGLAGSGGATGAGAGLGGSRSPAFGAGPLGASFGGISGAGASGAGATGASGSTGGRGAGALGANARGFGGAGAMGAMSGPGASLGSGAMSGFGPGGATGAGSAPAPGAGATAGGFGAASGTAAGGQGASRQGGFVGGPMAGANNQQRKEGSKRAKVKTVTSAVEREGNLKALLGDAPLLLPDVIGHNVRG